MPRIVVMAFAALIPVLGSHAAEPEQPVRDPLSAVPSQAVGVVGSGEQLSLRLRSGQNYRDLGVGQIYEQDWLLQALTDSIATFSRDGQIRRIGLNPTGAVAAAQDNGTRGDILTIGSGTRLAQALAAWNGKPRSGLTVEETRRLIELEAKARERLDELRPRAPITAAFGSAVITLSGRTFNDLYNALGTDGAEYRSLLERSQAASYSAALEAYNRLGPATLYVPPGANPEAVIAERGFQGAAFNGLLQTVDAAGGLTMTVASPRPPSNLFPGL